MSIVFFGATELGFACCQKIIDAGINVKAIFTIPQQFSIKYKNEKERKSQFNVLFKDFNHFNATYNITVHCVEGNINQYQNYLSDLQPDLIVVIGWYYMLPKEILDIPKKGSVAIHASLLPKYRGNAPLVWAMINGEKQTGISLFYLEGGMDEGDVIISESFSIEENETIKDVLLKAKNASLKIIDIEIKKILAGTSRRMQQNHSEASYFPKRTPKDGEIDWSWDNLKIKRFIRAQTKPYPGAFTKINNKKIIIWDADIITD
jgi:methionyl-tRNA formyltransferase